MKRNRVIATLAAMSFLPMAFSAEEVTREQLLEEFRKVIPDGAMGRATTFETNGYKVESSVNKELGTDRDQDGKLGKTGDELKHLVVTSPDLFQIIVARRSHDGKSAGGGLGVFHRDTGEPMLSIGDTDGDGRIDVLTYSVFDASGAYIIEVVDYEADGQADMRLHLKEKFFEIWHADRWRRVEVRGEKRGIVIDGKFIELQRGKNRWLVPSGV
jgi:hypothetical protein